MNGNRETVISFAGSELLRYLAAAGISRQQLPALDLKARDETHDSFSVCGNAGSVQISGSNPRSVLIGVYAYLRKLGFAFYAPGDIYTCVPALTELPAVPLFTERAASFHRGVCIEGSESIENMLAYIDWLPKAGMNACFIQFMRPDVFFRRWYEHEMNPEETPVRLTDAELSAFDEQMEHEVARRGLMLHRVGHGWTSHVLGYAGNGWQTEQDPTDPAVQRMIALYKGERRLFGGVPANTNLCYADEAVRQALVRSVVSYAKAHPTVDYLHFWLADTYNNVCECERCRQTTISDQYVEILNALDEALTAEGLGTHIVFLLYQELLYPPKTARLRSAERFTLMFAPISRTFEAPYPERFEPVPLPPYRRNEMVLPLNLIENLSYYQGWREVFSGDSFVYDYHLGRAHYGDFGYMTIAGTLYQDLHRLQGLGLGGMVACQELRVMMPNAFPIYVMGRALWDGAVTREQLLQEYFGGLYGDFAPEVIRYFTEISALCDTDYANANGPRLRPDLTPRYERAAELSRQMAEKTEALPETADDPVLTRLLATARQNELHAQAMAGLTAGDGERSAAAFTDFCRMIRADERRFQPELDVYRLIEVSQRFTGLREK